MLLKWLFYSARIAAALAGLVIGTESICGAAQNPWGVGGWLLSMIAAIILITSTSPPETKTHQSETDQARSAVLKLGFAIMIVFGLVVTTIQVIIEAGNP